MESEHRQIVTTVTGKFEIESGNPKAPVGNIIVKFGDSDSIKMATWNKGIFDKFHKGDGVVVTYNRYKEDPQFGKSACIVHIEPANKTLDPLFETAENYELTFNEMEKQKLQETNVELGNAVINADKLPDAPKEILLEEGKVYRVWNQFYRYSPAKFTLVEEE